MDCTNHQWGEWDAERGACTVVEYLSSLCYKLQVRAHVCKFAPGRDRAVLVRCQGLRAVTLLAWGKSEGCTCLCERRAELWVHP